MTLNVRDATLDDADVLVTLINAAYRVEDFFKLTDRIDRAEVLDKMQHGRFLVLEERDALAGCVYVEVNDRVGYFGLLSIDPSKQKQGLGARLIGIAEAACREVGCSEMEIWVVDLRPNSRRTTTGSGTSRQGRVRSRQTNPLPSPATSSSCASNCKETTIRGHDAIATTVSVNTGCARSPGGRRSRARSVLAPSSFRSSAAG
jgi:N-acetylglutamate synthase-like GNAT family acetyltransferase